MISVSQDYKNALDADNRSFYVTADITLWNGTTLSVDNTNIWQGGFQIKQAVSGQSAFEIGACVINELKLVLNNIGGAYDSYDFYGAEITASFGLYDSDGTLIDMDGNGNTTIQKGIYYVDEVESNGTLVTLTCLDAMVKFDRNFSDVSITYPSTLQNIVQKICQKCGVPYSMVSFHNSTYSVTTAPDDTTLTCRDVMTMVCQIACAYGTIDRFGEFTIDWFDTDFMQTVVPVDGDLDGGSFWVNVDSADGGSFWDLTDPHDSGTFIQQTTPDYALSGFFKFNRDHADVRISGVKLTQNSITYLSGSDRYIVEIQNNSLINAGDEATILSDIASRIIGSGMRPFSANHLADPTLEAGDTVTLTDHLGNTYRSVVTDTEFSAGEQQRTDCDAESYVSNQSIRYSSASKAIADYNVSSASSLVANAYGLYRSSIANPQSSGTTEAVHNASTFETSTFAMIKNENGLQTGTRATTSDSWTWTATDAAEGAGLQEVLDVVGINADWIRAGTINAIDITGSTITGGTISGTAISGGTVTGTTINNGSGTFVVDNSGNVTANNLTSANAVITGGSIELNTTTIGTGIKLSASDPTNYTQITAQSLRRYTNGEMVWYVLGSSMMLAGPLTTDGVQMTRRAGEYWQTGILYIGAGITSTSQQITCYLPSAIPITASSASVTSITYFLVRHVGGGYAYARSGSGSTYTSLNGTTIWQNSASYRTNEVSSVTATIRGNDGVTLGITFANALTTGQNTTAVTNNTPVYIQLNATILFS